MNDSIDSESQLDDLLSEPTEYVIESLARAPGDTIILGAGGKMGPTLSRMLARACQQAGDDRKITAVSRFSNDVHRQHLESVGVHTIAGDLLEEGFLDSLPDASNVIHMTGMKFGTGQHAAGTWAMNVFLPSQVCQRYRSSRIMAFSTGNVYPLVDVSGRWSQEDDPLGPVGEYAMSALGRERMFQYFAERYQIDTVLVRLNYAVEMRYGVLVDIATKVAQGDTIDLSMGYANVIWQADANALAIASLAIASSPAAVINVAGPELVSVQDVAKQFGELLDKPVQFSGQPAPTALLNDGSAAHRQFGPPRASMDQMIRWISDWIQRGQPLLGKPTHFEVRSGKF